ncbi:MAG: hypothetical protein ACR2NP_03440 [Pirellulaceae bacterium]
MCRISSVDWLALLVTQKSVGDILVVGSSTDYQETGGDWLSMGTNDIDGNGGLGTDGVLFFGNFDGTGANSQPWGTDIRSSPGYVTDFSAGAHFTSIADQLSSYGSIDHPVQLDGTDTFGGTAVGFGTGPGDLLEIVRFDINGLAPGQTVRVGILSGVEGGFDGRWDPTSITLSDGTYSGTVGDHNISPLPLSPGGVNAGWVFFDINSDGSYGILGTQRNSAVLRGVGIGGITFDSITVVPEPNSSALLVLSGLAIYLPGRRKK